MEYFACNVTLLGRAGRDIGWTGEFVPVSCLHLTEGKHAFYLIFCICASASLRACSATPTQSIKTAIDRRLIKIQLCGHIYADSNSRLHYSTLTAHMPKGHREMAEWTPERIVSWAASVGE